MHCLPPPSLCSLTGGVRVLAASEGVPGAGPGHGEVVHVVEHVPGHGAVLESEGRECIYLSSYLDENI